MLLVRLLCGPGVLNLGTQPHIYIYLIRIPDSNLVRMPDLRSMSNIIKKAGDLVSKKNQQVLFINLFMFLSWYEGLYSIHVNVERNSSKIVQAEFFFICTMHLIKFLHSQNKSLTNLSEYSQSSLFLIKTVQHNRQKWEHLFSIHLLPVIHFCGKCTKIIEQETLASLSILSQILWSMKRVTVIDSINI